MGKPLVNRNGRESKDFEREVPKVRVNCPICGKPAECKPTHSGRVEYKHRVFIGITPWKNKIYESKYCVKE
jgi:hypothetical protein